MQRHRGWLLPIGILIWLSPILSWMAISIAIEEFSDRSAKHSGPMMWQFFLASVAALFYYYAVIAFEKRRPHAIQVLSIAIASLSVVAIVLTFASMAVTHASPRVLSVLLLVLMKDCGIVAYLQMSQQVKSLITPPAASQDEL